MPLRNSTDTYDSVARWFHWATALLVLTLLGVGLYMTGLDVSPVKLTLYALHKSFGMLVLGLVVLRILWRAVNAHPHAHENHAAWERLLARLIHFLLYLGLLGMPLSGWLMSAAADFPRPFFGLLTFPDPIPGRDDDLFRIFRTFHELCAYAIIGAVGLHVAGALKHHVIDRDDTLLRMWPRHMLAFVAVMLALCVGLVGLYSITTKRPAPTGPVEAQVTVNTVEGESIQLADITDVRPDTNMDADINATADNAPSWAIMPAASHVEFTAIVQGAPFTGRFGAMDGTIRFDPDTASGAVDVTVRIDSVSSGNAERDSSMKAPVWFDAESFPESRFTATRFQKSTGNQYIADGTLTIRDVGRPLRLPFTLDLSTDSAGNKIAKMQSTFTLERLNFNVGQGEWQNTQTVENAVKVRVELTAQAAAPPAPAP